MLRWPSRLLRPASWLLVLLCHFLRSLRLAGAFFLVSRLVVGRAGVLGDLSDNGPVFLVGDREEAVVALEILLHFGREAEVIEALLDLVGEFRLQIMRIGEAGAREGFAAIDDTEVVPLDGAARSHALEDIGGDGRRVVVA